MLPSAAWDARRRVRAQRRAAHHNLLHGVHDQSDLLDLGRLRFPLFQVSLPSVSYPVWKDLLNGFYSRDLRCLRNTIHANLFITYMMTALFWILTLSFQVWHIDKSKRQIDWWWWMIESLLFFYSQFAEHRFLFIQESQVASSWWHCSIISASRTSSGC